MFEDRSNRYFKKDVQNYLTQLGINVKLFLKNKRKFWIKCSKVDCKILKRLVRKYILIQFIED